MNITLPDGSIRKMENGSTGLDLANDIGPGLAKAAIAVSVNNIQAIALYKKQGFTILTTKKKFYKNGTNAFSMQRKI